MGRANYSVNLNSCSSLSIEEYYQSKQNIINHLKLIRIFESSRNKEAADLAKDES